MACSNCGKGSAVQPARSNGGLFIMNYIGTETEIAAIGSVTGVVYKFGTKKRDFWVDHKDIVGLFASPSGIDLRSTPQ